MQARSAEKIENTVYTLILLGILATVLSGFRVVHLHKTYSVTESILVNKQSEVIENTGLHVEGYAVRKEYGHLPSVTRLDAALMEFLCTKMLHPKRVEYFYVLSDGNNSFRANYLIMRGTLIKINIAPVLEVQDAATSLVKLFTLQIKKAWPNVEVTEGRLP